MTTINTPATLPPAAEKPPRKKKRVFMWTFLAIQAAFIAWVASVLFAGTGASPAAIAQTCGNHAWYPLWKSYNDCAAHSGIVAAHDIGKGLAIAAILGTWVAIDVILGIGRLVVVFARRRSA